MPFTTVKKTGRKMSPTRYHEIMNTEIPEHTRMLRCRSMANMPGLSTLLAAISCSAGLGSLTKSQMSTAQISPGTARK